jgi:hypothetical protein
LLIITLAASRKSRSKLGFLASSLSLRVIPSIALATRLATTLATRSAVALATTVALSPFKKSLTIRVGLGQSQKASLVSCSTIYLKEAVDSNVI